MTPGSRSRRIAVGTAIWTMAVLSGCHGVPVTRLTGPPPIPNRPLSSLGPGGRPGLFTASAALETPAELAAIDPSNSAHGNITRTSALEDSGRATLISTDPTPASAEPAKPTPLLDAALIQARNRGELPAETESSAASVPESTMPLLPVTEVVATPAPNPSPPAPVMTSVPTPEPKPAEVAAPVPPEEQWRDGVHKLVGLARSKQEQGGTSGSEPWGLRTRVLAWLAEPEIDPDFGGREPDGVRSVLHALEATTPADPTRSSGDPRGRGNDIRAAVQTLEARAPLELVELQICQEVRVFGDLVPFATPARAPGDWVVIYCEVDGLHQEATSGGYQTRVESRVQIIPEGGGAPIGGPVDISEDTTPRRRRDYFLASRKYLPPTLAPGRYTLQVTITDTFANRTATRTVPLTIARGQTGESGGGLPPEPTRSP